MLCWFSNTRNDLVTIVPTFHGVVCSVAAAVILGPTLSVFTVVARRRST